MAEHKVPQDVEAEDKLIGPFSFRQFVYLMVAVGAGFLAFVLSGIAIPLAFIPAPVCLFFLVLALPLRKDQPTEIYFAALIKYAFKPRVRVWKADGEQPLVEISNPTTDDAPKTKDLAGDEVSRRLSFLANLSDTRGWSTRGIGAPPVNNTNLTDGFANEAANVEDVMDNSAVSDHIDNLLDQSEKKVRQDAIDRMNAAIRQQSAAQTPANMFPQTSLDGFNQPVAAVQPQQYTYAQQVVQPLSQPVQQASNYNYQAPTLVTPPQSLQSASQPVVNQTPDLSGVSNLPTYDYNSIIHPSISSSNLQMSVPEPMHNQRLAAPSQASEHRTTVQYAQGSRPAPTPSTPTNVATPAPALTTVAEQSSQASPQQATLGPGQLSQNEQSQSVVKPVEAQKITTDQSQSKVNSESNTQPAKPDIIDNDNAKHQPVIDAPTDDSIIDIKLH